MRKINKILLLAMVIGLLMIGGTANSEEKSFMSGVGEEYKGDPGAKPRKFGNAPTAQTAKKVMTRDEFRKAVMWKTPQQVIQAIGKPEYTRETGQMMDFYYHKLTKDSYTGKVDDLLIVSFWDGFVDHVIW